MKAPDVAAWAEMMAKLTIEQWRWQGVEVAKLAHALRLAHEAGWEARERVDVGPQLPPRRERRAAAKRR